MAGAYPHIEVPEPILEQYTCRIFVQHNINTRKQVLTLIEVPSLEVILNIYKWHFGGNEKNKVARGAYVSPCVLRIFEKPFLSGIPPNP